MSNEELKKETLKLAEEYLLSLEGQMTLGTVCHGGMEAIGMLLMATPDEFMRFVASLSILKKAELDADGKLMSDEELGNAAWAKLKEDSGPDWWKTIPQDVLKTLKPEFLADIPPEAFEGIEIPV